MPIESGLVVSNGPATRKIMFVVSSLMGAGHLQRILLIANAVERAGGTALIVSGGRVPDHLDTGRATIRHLPPVWSDGVDYSRLLTPHGEADEAYFAQRGESLCAHFDEFLPDVVVTELFPFGRRALSVEFMKFLTHAHGRARIFASIRDVLEPKKKPKRHAETAERLRAWYDGVLVHGDPQIIGLDATWPLSGEVSDLISYTGYVCAPEVERISADEILVAVGGGVIGRNMLSTAIQAARGGTRFWRLRVGGTDAPEVARALQRVAGDAPVIVEPAASDYRARLAGCACSVSLFGYNTATDLLISAPPAVISPMDEGGEREQIIRADAFGKVPGFIRLSQMSPNALREAVETAILQASPKHRTILTDGARKSAEILMTVGQ